MNARRIAGLSPLEVTEKLLAFAKLPKVCAYGRFLSNGRPWTVNGRLSQARMWREYAQAWDGRPIDRGYVGWPNGHRVIIGREWVEKILRASREDCIRRSRVNLYLAKRIRRGALAALTGPGRPPVDADSTPEQ